MCGERERLCGDGVGEGTGFCARRLSVFEIQGAHSNTILYNCATHTA